MDPARLQAASAVLAALRATAPPATLPPESPLFALSATGGWRRELAADAAHGYVLGPALAPLRVTAGKATCVAHLPTASVAATAAGEPPAATLRGAVPFLQPMVAEGPSAKFVKQYRESGEGEAMSLVGHVSEEARVSRRSGRQAAPPLPLPTEHSAPPPAAVPLLRRTTDFDAVSFRAHFDAAGHVAAAGLAASIAAVCGSTSPRACNPLAAASDTHDAWATSDAAGRSACSTCVDGACALPRHRGPIPLRTPAGAATSAAQARVVAVGEPPHRPAFAAASPCTPAHGAGRMVARPHYSRRTNELLLSLTALRDDLQAREAARRHNNRLLARDPADWDHLHWARSAPHGHYSPYAY